MRPFLRKRSGHEPIERWFEFYEMDENGDMVKTGDQWKVMCGCTEDLLYEWGHDADQ